MSNFMNIRAVGPELFHVDRRTDMTIANRKFWNAPKNCQHDALCLSVISRLLLAIRFKTRYRYNNPCTGLQGSWRLRLPYLKTICRWWEGCQPYAQADFNPQKIFLVLISVRRRVDFRAIVRLEGYINEKFQWHHRELNRFVAQRLNQLHHREPPLIP